MANVSCRCSFAASSLGAVLGGCEQLVDERLGLLVDLVSSQVPVRVLPSCDGGTQPGAVACCGLGAHQGSVEGFGVAVGVQADGAGLPGAGEVLMPAVLRAVAGHVVCGVDDAGLHSAAQSAHPRGWMFAQRDTVDHCQGTLKVVEAVLATADPQFREPLELAPVAADFVRESVRR